MEKFQFQIECGCIKKGNSWITKNPKANVVIFEGMEEHLARYDHFAQFLNRYGYDVYGVDYFGQGENINDDASNIGMWPIGGFNKQVNICFQLIEKLKKETKLPTYIFAHSMGSFIAQAYMIYYPTSVSKICLCGSGGKNKALGIGNALANIVVNKNNCDDKAKFLNKLMFGSFNKKISNPKTSFDWLSYNEDNVNKYIADPKCGFGPRNRFCQEFIKGMLPLYKKENLRKIDINTHLFIISGDADPVTNYGKFVHELTKMYKGLGLKDVKEKIYPNMRHEILNELDWEIVAKDIVDFYN